MKKLILPLLFLFTTHFAIGQQTKLKKPVSTDEIRYLQTTIANIVETDQQYRNCLAKETLNPTVIAQIDSVFEMNGIEAGLKYEQSLHLSLDKEVVDSLWQLQHAIDLTNHLTLRGIFATYGFLSKDILGENDYVQLLLLVHPPKDWDVAEYLEEYSALFQIEIEAGRMPAKIFATFYDNIKGKILGELQLYGTNEIYDRATQKILPPIIADLKASNQARKKIGLPPLEQGEYRLSKPE